MFVKKVVMKKLIKSIALVLLCIYFGTNQIFAYSIGESLDGADATFLGSEESERLYLPQIVPDINGDGFDDLVIGSADKDKVFIFFGKSSGWATGVSTDQADVIIEGSDIGKYVGDVNNDGYGDLVLQISSTAYLVLGKKDWVSSYQVTDLATAEFSFSLMGSINDSGYVGDVNGDGYDDFAIGAPLGLVLPSFNARGHVYLILGKDSFSSSVDLITESDASWNSPETTFSNANYFGNAVNYTGDVNNDGYDDFIVSSYEDPAGGNDLGRAYLFYGKASGWSLDGGSTDANANFIGVTANTRAGTITTSPKRADFNYDGYDDVYFGGTGNAAVASYGGSTYLFFGPDPGWGVDKSVNEADAYYLGTRTEERLGYPLSAADLNLDGITDLFMGSGRHDYGNNTEGTSWLVNGKTSRWSTAVNITDADASWVGENAGDDAKASSTGDANGDGIDDFIIGSRYNDESYTDAGKVYLFLNEVGSTSSPEYKIRIPSGDVRTKIPEANVTIDFDAVTSSNGYVTVTEHLNQEPVSDSTVDTLSKYWTIEPTDLSSYSYNLTFKYSDYDISGVTSEDNLNIYYKDSNDDWNKVSSQIDTDTNRIWTTSAVDHFSDWMIGTERDAPTGVDIKSEVGYSTSRTPNVTFSKATDPSGILPSSGLNHYRVYLDKGKLSQQCIENIPTQGNGEANYVWKDDDNVKVIFLHEEDDDTDNDRIRVEFKQLKDKPLVEGEHTWSVEAWDSVGNGTITNESIMIDLTAPQIEDFAVGPLFSSSIWSGQMVSNESVVYVPTQFEFLGFSGLGQDLFSSHRAYYPNEQVQTYEKVAAGPEKIKLTIEKRDDQQQYESYFEKEYYFGLDGELKTDIETILGEAKEAQFYFANDLALGEGYYKITVEIFDTVNNSSTKIFYVNLSDKNSSDVDDQVSNMSRATSGGITQQTDSEEMTAEEAAAVQMYTLKVKVVDQTHKPIEGANVTIHSKLQQATTDENGVVTFTNVEPGDHKVVVNYNDEDKEETIDLSKDNQEFTVQVTVVRQNLFLKPVSLLFAGVGILFILLLFFTFKRSKKK